MGVLPEKIEKWILPIFLIAFEVIMLILYGVLVEYDTLGTPAPVNMSANKFHSGDPLAQVEKVYPCESVGVIEYCMQSQTGYHLNILNGVD